MVNMIALIIQMIQNLTLKLRNQIIISQVNAFQVNETILDRADREIGFVTEEKK